MISKIFTNRILLIGWGCIWFITACACESVSTRSVNDVRIPNNKPAESFTPDVDLNLFKKVGNDETADLRDGDILTGDDEYAIIFKAKIPAHIYIFQIDTNGKMEKLFPNQKFTDNENPLVPKEQYRIPYLSHWFVLDSNKGEELFVLMACKEELKAPEEICKKIADDHRFSHSAGLGNRADSSDSTIKNEQDNDHSLSGKNRSVVDTHIPHMENLLIKKIQILHK